MANENNENARTIRVMGDCSIDVAPDTTVLRFDLDSLHEDYAHAYETASMGNEKLRDALEKLGIAPGRLKTTHFSIDKKFESVREKGVYKSVFKGFTLRQNLRLELPIDSLLTSKVMYELGKAWPDLEVNISYTIGDTEQVKLTMLEKGVKDARRKANVMAQALGHELGDIHFIDYSKIEVDFSVHSYQTKSMCLYEPVRGIDMEPEDISLEDSVLTVWTLK